MKSQFITNLDKRDISDKEFVLLAPLVYRSELLGGEISVPTGFVSDGSSVPRLPFVYWFFGDRAHHESVVHDYLFRVPEHIVEVRKLVDGECVVEKVFVSQRLADAVFKEAMAVRQNEKDGFIEKQRKNWFIRNAMWSAVRIGGRSSYKSGPDRYQIKSL